SDPSRIDQPSLRYFFATTQADRDAATYAGSSTSAAQDFIFDDNGAHTVYTRILDKDGGYTDYQTTVAVTDVPPSATLSNNGPVAEGSAATVSFSNPLDPSTADSSAGFRYSFALSPAALAGTYAYAVADNSRQFAFGDNGSYIVYGRIFDKDDGYTGYQTTVL